MSPERITVVGAGLAGLRTAEQLRAHGYTGRITMIGAEKHLPYDRPPLSKQILLGSWEVPRTALCDEKSLAELAVSARLGRRATALHDTTIELDDGSTVSGDAVVIATGVVPRTLPGQPASVQVLRTLDDALALRHALETVRSLLVVGAGFIGGEVASAAKKLGLDVTVTEAQSVPCERVLGPQVGAAAARLFLDGGVDLRCGAGIAHFVDEHTLALTDGTCVGADVVLVGVGATPDLAWLDGSGLGTGDGLACDAEGRVLGADAVWAVGDVAAKWDGARGRHHRAEHWTSAGDQALAAARSILGLEPPPPVMPYVWSDQFGLRIQMVGRTDLAGETVVLHGQGLDGGPVKGTVAGYFAEERLVGVVGFGAPRHVVAYRALVTAGADRAATLRAARELLA
ncbi:NAD(P)/FAD-dependent oxidoreductase [Streptomyces sp. NPDC101455]|uniref:NAD(P)/FAD-dependent oxidoreductase n=1 Tax=Streptomyces sp. NPDC101455 TaxID=3366142 RepID=UPI00381192C5